MKTYLVLAVAVLVEATGNVLLSKGMKFLASASAAGESDLLLLFSYAVRTPTIWLGTALLLIFFLLFATVLSWADLSFVVPAISVEVIVNVAFADYFLKEPVSMVRWVGTMLIFIGVLLVLRSGQENGWKKQLEGAEDR